MPQKALRDPIHNHIYFDKKQDKLILDLLSCPEVQRLRRIRQLGVSSVTYPGAEHSRFGHALGACHLMALALRALKNNQPRLRIPPRLRVAALAAALLHDIGHAPFSHVLEGELFSGTRHEEWTLHIIRRAGSAVNKVLREYDASLPDAVGKLIEGRLPGEDSWASCLIHSQADVDRMDYLLRDSHFCGVGYGQYDVERILHTMRIRQVPSLSARQPVWLEKGRTAVEEYLFARYYMYWNVYYHPTTRGYEELLRAILRRATQLARRDAKRAGECPHALLRVLLGGALRMKDFLSLDDNVIWSQVLHWRNGAAKDRILRDLSRRFIDRDGLKPIELRGFRFELTEAMEQARRTVRASGFRPEFYFLTNRTVTSAYDCYHPEEDTTESSADTSILIEERGLPGKRRSFLEISRVSPRLKGITGSREERLFCYVPEPCRNAVASILGAAVSS